MEQTDVKNKKITRRQIIMVVAFLAVIIILAVVLWPKPVQQRQHVYFIVQDARVDFYWDSRTVGAGIAAKTITYQYDGGVHFPDITIYDEQTGERIPKNLGYLGIKITYNGSLDGTDSDTGYHDPSDIIYHDPIDKGRYGIKLSYNYVRADGRVIYHDSASFTIEII